MRMNNFPQFEQKNYADLSDILLKTGRCSIAVSGGVDSMTLATLAHRIIPTRVLVFHATSPAVPDSALTRIQEYAQRENWNIAIVDAREFRDSDYISNPVDRCFYCKNNLYTRLTSYAGNDGVFFSGTNTDDLQDYRPGLHAAKIHRIRHPYVEAGINKQGVRDLAYLLELKDLYDLPASPCLSSRVETGIPIHTPTLKNIDQVEQMMRLKADAKVVRCRIRKDMIEIELDQKTLATLSDARRQYWSREVSKHFTLHHLKPVTFSIYRKGSAFIKKQ
jgi:uncharacterized protein